MGKLHHVPFRLWKTQIALFASLSPKVHESRTSEQFHNSGANGLVRKARCSCHASDSRLIPHDKNAPEVRDPVGPRRNLREVCKRRQRCICTNPLHRGSSKVKPSDMNQFQELLAAEPSGFAICYKPLHKPMLSSAKLPKDTNLHLAINSPIRNPILKNPFMGELSAQTGELAILTCWIPKTRPNSWFATRTNPRHNKFNNSGNDTLPKY